MPSARGSVSVSRLRTSFSCGLGAGRCGSAVCTATDATPKSAAIPAPQATARWTLGESEPQRSARSVIGACPSDRSAPAASWSTRKTSVSCPGARVLSGQAPTAAMLCLSRSQADSLAGTVATPVLRRPTVRTLAVGPWVSWVLLIFRPGAQCALMPALLRTRYPAGRRRWAIARSRSAMVST